MAPKVSVIMPVYNCAQYVGAAISSVLMQTYTDYELIIIDDGSTDGSGKVIASYKDPRIILITNEKNTGLANVRNKGLQIANGEYVAWLDSDDVSLNTRLEKQVKLLDSDAELGLCGTWVKTIDTTNEEIWRYPVQPDFLRARMLFDDPLATSSVMVKRNCLDSADNNFNLEYPPAEDYELWERISRKWKIANIPEILTLYRVHPAQTSVVKVEKQKSSILKIQNRILSQLDIRPSPEEIDIHLDIGVGWRFLPDRDRMNRSERWLQKLRLANQRKKVFPVEGFRDVLAERWLAVCRGATNSKYEAWYLFLRSPLRAWYPITTTKLFSLLAR